MTSYIEKRVSLYLNKKLDMRHHEIVYGLSSHWGSLRGLGRFAPFYSAAWSIQKRLVQEFKYQECPYCHWATHHPENHEWCQNEMNPEQTKD